MKIIPKCNKIIYLNYKNEFVILYSWDMNGIQVEKNE